MTKHLLVVGDNSRMRKDFERFYDVHPDFPNFVHCCVTSPPYKDKDGYDTLNIDNVAETLNEFLLGPLWLNFGDLAGQMSLAPLTALFFQDWGFCWKQTIIWAKHLDGKGQFTANSSEYMFTGHHEYIYLMYPWQHEEFYKLNRYADGVPYTDKTNTKRWKHGRTVRDPGTIWFIPYETVTGSGRKDLNSKTGKVGHGKHPNEFPLELPARCLRCTVLPENGWVLDPWGGSGTTALAAKNLNLNSLTYEVNPKMVEVIRERIPDVEVIE